MMNAEHFLKIVAARELLSSRAIDRLRAQLGPNAKTMSAEALAKMLIQKGHLTKHQAKQILKTQAESPDEEKPTEPDQDTSASHLGFAPLEEDDRPARAKPKPKPTQKPTPKPKPKPTPKPKPKQKPKPPPPAQPHPKPPPPPEMEERPRQPSRDAPDLEDEQVVLEPEPGTGPAAAGSDAFDLLKPIQPPPAPPGPQKPIPTGPANLADDLPDPSSLPATDATLPTGKRKPIRRRSRRSKAKQKARDAAQSEWESPLMLVGGGALLLLVLVGSLVWFLLKRDTGDDVLKAANTHFANGSYTQAIHDYEKFLEGFPHHLRVSEARVQLGVARIRQETESTSDYGRALQVAKDQIRAIEDEEKFSDATGDLADLLEQIVRGLAQAAVDAEEPDVVAERSAQANEGLKLINNTKYVPNSQRPVEAINSVRQMLGLVARRQERNRHRSEALTAIQSATEAGDTRKAYAAYRSLIDLHPEFAIDPLVAEAVSGITAAERSSVQFQDAPKQAIAGTEDEPILPSVIMADCTNPPPSDRTSRPLWIRIQGGLYAFDADSGALLWRRFVGIGQSKLPLSIQEDVLVIDTTDDALVRFDGKSGQVRWRLHVGEPLLAPVLRDDQILLATGSGKLLLVEADTGTTPGYIQFAQSIPVPPLVDTQNGRVCVVGGHSSVYVLVGEKLVCRDVFHLGHRSSSITVPPVTALGHLIIAENQGQESARLHVLSFQADGTLTEKMKPMRLEGQVTTAPAVDGRRLVVMTDLGEIRAFDVAVGQAENILIPVAGRPATGRFANHYGLLQDGRLWVADTRLSQLTILPAGSRIQAEDLQDHFDGDVFDYPLIADGNRMVHVRQRSKRAGTSIAAVETRGGRIVWQTHWAAPPAGAPIIDSTNRAIIAGNQSGFVFVLNEAALHARVQNQALPRNAYSNILTFDHSVDLGNGTAVFSTVGQKGVLAYRSDSADSQLAWLKLADPLACSPTALAGGILCPSQIGQVFLLDPRTGAELATPFQPRLSPQQAVEWTQPCAAADGRSFVIADRSGSVHLVELTGTQPIAMEAVATSAPLAAKIVTPAAMIGETVLVGTENNHLHYFSLPEMKQGPDLDLGGPIAWGPHMAGRRAAVVATESGTLIAVLPKGNIAWRKELGAAPVGRPLLGDGSVTLALPQGRLVQLALSNGEIEGQVDTHQPLAAGPVEFGKRWILTTYDGNLLIVDPLEPSE